MQRNVWRLNYYCQPQLSNSELLYMLVRNGTSINYITNCSLLVHGVLTHNLVSWMEMFVCFIWVIVFSSLNVNLLCGSIIILHSSALFQTKMKYELCCESFWTNLPLCRYYILLYCIAGSEYKAIHFKIELYLCWYMRCQIFCLLKCIRYNCLSVAVHCDIVRNLVPCNVQSISVLL